MLSRNLIRLNLDVKSKEEAIRILAEDFVEAGVVKESFVDAVLEREQESPTALPAVAYDVAIPHTVSAHVITPAMNVAVLKHPVEFQQMGSPDVTLHPQVLFMLAISDPKDQLSLLRRIMKMLQNKDLLNQIRAAKSEDEIYGLLKPVIEV
ncbi:PTS system fructose-specific EIIABC component [Caprobacter fermentans]|uniref:PTS sugar transporter subunit IIA n=1 Tax=Caproicibacter fermentans TaxID=2576756 RepID=A0A6N8HWD8_9FIRM|nr:PTS sugar transporter subunit IIA [Caproicibacter fermentans]MVB10106.1 PTS system fructose-specific EIIABC component [Caproicibacter fermentans]OCN03372.1 transcriptional regulator [Clostridium sp. W14A]QNK40177.1 PTS sugar transporter subunit IIA [Caproicibacter fermentans]